MTAFLYAGLVLLSCVYLTSACHLYRKDNADGKRGPPPECLPKVSHGTSCPSVTGSPVTRFFFDVSSRRCLDFNYAGCGGNPNRFMSKSECEDRCARDCSEEDDGGPPMYIVVILIVCAVALIGAGIGIGFFIYHKCIGKNTRNVGGAYVVDRSQPAGHVSVEMTSQPPIYQEKCQP